MAYRKKFNEGFRAGQFDAYWHRGYNPSNDVPILRPVVNVEAYEEGYAAGFGSQTLTGEFSPVPFSWEYHHGQCQVEIGRGGAIKYRGERLRVKSLPGKDKYGIWHLKAQHGIHSNGWRHFSTSANEINHLTDLHVPEDCRPDIYIRNASTVGAQRLCHSDLAFFNACPVCQKPWVQLKVTERETHLLEHLGIKNAYQS